jgi:hypothetical protein
MTDTITTTDPEYGTDHMEGPEAPLGGTLEHLDPTSLVADLSAQTGSAGAVVAGRKVGDAFAT